MKQGDIRQVVVHYLAENHRRLKGTMPNSDYFLVTGRCVGESSRDDNIIKKGTLIDVIADTIQKNDFFGWYVSDQVGQATNQNNAQIEVIKSGKAINAELKFKKDDSGLYVVTHEVKPKKYLDSLRTPEGFVQAATLLGINRKLESIAFSIYSN